MGTMNFQLPNKLPAEAVRELGQACVIGGPDNMPWPSQVKVDASSFTVGREVDESGCVVVPWPVDGAGLIMTSTATLMERSTPYQLQLELARGKINQLRSQAADWRTGGLQVPPGVLQQIRDASMGFVRAITAYPAEDSATHAQAALTAGCRTADHLVQAYIEQVFQVRHQRQPRLETAFGCNLGSTRPEATAADAVLNSCNSVHFPCCWREVEPAEATYNWEPHDALLDWVEAQGLSVIGGPLIDFSPGRLPDWLWLWEKDLHSLASFMCDYVETAVKRYRGRIRCWQLTAGANWTSVLGLGEDELLWLTVRLAEAARQVDSGLDLLIGIAQPWGEYLATEDRTHSPFIFADTLIRAGLNLAAVDLEWIMGVTPRGSYCRDLLDGSRLLDMYALLGVPLQVTIGYPSSAEADPLADPELSVGAGHWHKGVTPETQAEWAAAFAAVAICKPFVRGVHWTHLSDAEPHQFPNCGLLDAKGQTKPALSRLRELREEHLR